MLIKLLPYCIISIFWKDKSEEISAVMISSFYDNKSHFGIMFMGLLVHL